MVERFSRQLDVRQSFASGISACTRMSQSYWSLRLLKLFLGTTYETLKQGAKTPEHLGVIKLPMLGGVKQCKSMVIFRDFPYNSALFGLVMIQWTSLKLMHGRGSFSSVKSFRWELFVSDLEDHPIYIVSSSQPCWSQSPSKWPKCYWPQAFICHCCWQEATPNVYLFSLKVIFYFLPREITIKPSFGECFFVFQAP